MIYLNLNRRFTACLFRLCSVLFCAVSACYAQQGSASAGIETMPLTWEKLASNEAPSVCTNFAEEKKYLLIKKIIYSAVIEQYINVKKNYLSGYCIRDMVHDKRYVYDQYSKIALKAFGDVNGSVFLATYTPEHNTRIIRLTMSGISFLDVPMRISIPYLDATELNDGSIIITANESGSQGGLYVITVPTAQAGASTLTHWPQADFFLKTDTQMLGVSLCDGHQMRLVDSNGSNATPVVGITCQVTAAQGAHRFRLTPKSARTGTIEYIHGGPGGNYLMSSGLDAWNAAFAGFDIEAVNYTDATPSPVGEDARRQIAEAQEQIAEAWVDLKRENESSSPPIVVAESFGFPLIAKILEMPGPLSIVAISPLTSGRAQMDFTQSLAQKVGLPYARWPDVYDLYMAVPDLVPLLCSRPYHTALRIIAAHDDPVFGDAGRQFVERLKSCPKVELKYDEFSGADHATTALWRHMLEGLAGEEAVRRVYDAAGFSLF